MDFCSVGSASGLRLTLNLEQYEYMKGPQNDAGVKVRGSVEDYSNGTSCSYLSI